MLHREEVITMDNDQVCAYAWVAVQQLQAERKEITPDRVSGRMANLMDMYSEKEIEEIQKNI